MFAPPIRFAPAKPRFAKIMHRLRVDDCFKNR